MSASTVRTADVVNSILGIDDDSPIAQLRNQKPTLVAELQEYYLSIFEPTEASAAAFPLVDRALVAIRVASHTGSTAVATWYEGIARSNGASNEAIAAALNVPSSADGESSLDAAFRHADLLTTRPVDARKSDLDALKAAGFTPAGIVSLSQTIAFVSYQLRLIAGLRAFGGDA